MPMGVYAYGPVWGPYGPVWGPMAQYGGLWPSMGVHAYGAPNVVASTRRNFSQRRGVAILTGSLEILAKQYGQKRESKSQHTHTHTPYSKVHTTHTYTYT